MATIEERKQQLENKLKKMAEDNVVVKPVTIPNSFDLPRILSPPLQHQGRKTIIRRDERNENSKRKTGR